MKPLPITLAVMSLIHQAIAITGAVKNAIGLVTSEVEEYMGEIDATIKSTQNKILTYYEEMKEAPEESFVLSVNGKWNKIPCHPDIKDSGCGNLKCATANSKDENLQQMYDKVGGFCLPNKFCGISKHGIIFECSSQYIFPTIISAAILLSSII